MSFGDTLNSLRRDKLTSETHPFARFSETPTGASTRYRITLTQGVKSEKWFHILKNIAFPVDFFELGYCAKGPHQMSNLTTRFQMSGD